MFTLDTLDIVLLSGLGFFFVIQLFYLWLVLAKPYRHIQKLKKNEVIFSANKKLPVSIIIYVRNEYFNLEYLLPALLEQDYPEFEVIVVNDGVSDENEELLARAKIQYHNLYSTNLPGNTKNVSRKKLGITLGIKAAKYDTLLFTEVDSIPKTNHWISSMMRNFRDKKSIVLGVSVKKKSKGFSALFIAYDYLFSHLQVLSLALSGHPYSGDGHNMAYEKKHFNEGKGFARYRFLKEGDDDLFINNIATRENTAVELSPQSIVETWISSWGDYKYLKKNAAVTKSFYKGNSSLFWDMEIFSRVGFFLFFCACFVIGIVNFEPFVLPVAALFCFIVRLYSQLFVLNKTAACWSDEHFYFSLPLLDFIQPFVNAYFFLYRIFRRRDNYVTKL